MYLIPCPNCTSSLSVSPSQAGDSIRCGSCGESVPIPKLGELRKLPRAIEDTSSPEGATHSGNQETGSRVGFVLTACLATASLLVAGFCTIRWAIFDASMTTEAHIAEYEQAYKTASPALLIRDFEEMEERGIELPVLYNYKRLELDKQAWGRNAMASGSIALVSAMAAALLARSRRKRT